MDKEIDLEEQYDKIYRYCYFKIHKREMAEDITQETFLRFLESDTYQNTGKALQYLYTVARNLCIDQYRKKQRENLWEEITDEASVGNSHAMEEQLITTLTLRAALEELSEEERELVLLRYVNEVPVAVIGKLYGMSRFAVYRRTKEVLEALQRKLGREDFV